MYMACTHVCLCICLSVGHCLCMCVCVCVYAYMCPFAFVCQCVPVSVCVCVCVCACVQSDFWCSLRSGSRDAESSGEVDGVYGSVQDAGQERRLCVGGDSGHCHLQQQELP